MRKFRNVTVERVTSIENGDMEALRKCVVDDPELNEEFFRDFNPSIVPMPERWKYSTAKFIEHKDLHIVDRKPTVVLRTTPYARYEVDVTYTIEW